MQGQPASGSTNFSPSMREETAILGIEDRLKWAERGRNCEDSIWEVLAKGAEDGLEGESLEPESQV